MWELFVPGVEPGERYKYEIRARTGRLVLKADPLAFAAEHAACDRLDPPRPGHAGATTTGSTRRRAAPARRAAVDLRGAPRVVAPEPARGQPQPHLPELADELGDYAADLGFTHVELLPVMEHPFDGLVGLPGRAATTRRPRRLGSPDDFRAFVDRLHAARHRRDPRLGAGALPARRVRARPASTAPRSTSTRTRAAARIPDWGTLVFNYGRPEVRNFLVANALFWLRRVPRRRPAGRRRRLDALPRLLARGRASGSRTRYGGNEDLEAIAFLRELNTRRARARAGRDHGGRGVDRLARRLAAGRRAAGSASASSGTWAGCTTRSTTSAATRPSQAPPRPAHLRAALRLHGELHPAALPRRGRARQGVAAHEDARRPLAAAREPARAATRTCGRIPARSCCSWAASSHRSRSGATTGASTGTCSSGRSTPASRRSCAT